MGKVGNSQGWEEYLSETEQCKHSENSEKGAYELGLFIPNLSKSVSWKLIYVCKSYSKIIENFEWFKVARKVRVAYLKE